MAIEIFFSYAHEDERLKEDVRRHLVIFERNGRILKWHDRLITAGSEWQEEIDSRLKRAGIILVFISPAFIASRYCYEVEGPTALQRHEGGEARVLPIILRPCAWQETPFGKLQVLPKEGKPLTKWEDRDEACLDVALGIMAAVEEIHASKGNRGGPLNSVFLSARERVDLVSEAVNAKRIKFRFIEPIYSRMPPAPWEPQVVRIRLPSGQSFLVRTPHDRPRNEVRALLGADIDRWVVEQARASEGAAAPQPLDDVSLLRVDPLITPRQIAIRFVIDAASDVVTGFMCRVSAIAIWSDEIGVPRFIKLIDQPQNWPLRGSDVQVGIEREAGLLSGGPNSAFGIPGANTARTFSGIGTYRATVEMRVDGGDLGSHDIRFDYDPRYGFTVPTRGSTRQSRQER